MEKQIDNNNYIRYSWNKIKSKYILRKIFDNLKENKLLEIIRYNKAMKKNLNKVIKDYIKEYSIIEIEIIPLKNKYGNFINIKGNYQPYAHIYFNDNKNKEIKRFYINKEDKATKIKIILGKQIKTLAGLFHGCRCIKSINFIKFNRTDIKNMSYMFSGCSFLQTINFTNFNTQIVTKMQGMFSNCEILKELDLS